MLLAEHIDKDNFLPKKSFAESYLTISKSRNAKELGDTCLFVSGVFPAYGDTDYFVGIGRSSYNKITTLNCDLWLGTSQYRDFSPDYVPFKWRAWWDFGCGALGDMGCHIMDYPFWALKLGAPLSVEGYSSPVYEETAPQASLITYKFNSGIDGSLLDLIWYDGGLKPNIPKGLESDNELWSRIGGVIFYGEDGVLVYGHHKPKPILIVNGKKQNYEKPKGMIPRSVGHYQEWINEIKGAKQRAMSNFDYAGPLNEAVLLGNVAIRAGKKIIWDSEKMKVSNVTEANQYMWEDYRNGWNL